MKIEFTREQIEKVYDEIDRRIEMYTSDVLNTCGCIYEEDIKNYRNDVLQGVYATLMTLASNWSQVRFMTDQIEEERY